MIYIQICICNITNRGIALLKHKIYTGILYIIGTYILKSITFEKTNAFKILNQTGKEAIDFILCLFKLFFIAVK